MNRRTQHLRFSHKHFHTANAQPPKFKHTQVLNKKSIKYHLKPKTPKMPPKNASDEHAQKQQPRGKTKNNNIAV